MNIKLEVVHTIRGRARIRVRSKYDPAALFVVIQATLQELEEIRKVELNPYARSVTLHYTKSEALDLLLEKWKNLLFEVMNAPTFHDQLEQIEESLKYSNGNRLQVRVRDRILTITHTMDNAVKRITGNTIDLKTALPVGAFTAGLATLALAPALPTPTWLVLLIFSFSSFNTPKAEDNQEQSLGPVVPRDLLRLGDGKVLEQQR